VSEITVQLGPGGSPLPCHPNETIAVAARRAGWSLAVGCREGGCGVCKIHITSGEYELTGPMSRKHVTAAEQAAGYSLACRTRPLGPVVIDQYQKLRRIDAFRTQLVRMQGDGETWIEEDLE